MANFLLCVLFYIIGAIDFGMAASDLSKKRYYWFGFDLMAGILATVFMIDRWLAL